MPSLSPDGCARLLTSNEKETETRRWAVMHKFGNGSDCWNTHTNELSSSAAAAVMKD